MTVRTWRVTRVWRDVEAPTAIGAQAHTALVPSDYTSVHRDIDGLETRRRDFMADEPELYAYIEARGAARELERGAGDASGAVDGYGAANRLYANAARWEQKWRGLLQ